MKNKIIILASLFVGFILTGCNDFIDTEPKDRVSDRLMWQDEEKATLYLNFFYTYIHDFGTFGEKQFSQGTATEGLTETLKYGSYQPGAKAGDANLYIFTPEMMTASGNLLEAWGSGYDGIRRINEYLHSQEKYSTLGEDVDKKLAAQARFFRAFLYFQLAKRHGGVILYESLDQMQFNTNRSSEEATWDLIVKDLDYAAGILPTQWPTKDNGRVTKGAVYALKSRAMLYAERWQAAVDAADAVFAQGIYDLEVDYANAWKGKNKESILEYDYVQLKTGPYHSYDRDYCTYGEHANAGGAGVPTQEMVESYESATGQKVDWTAWHTAAGTTVRPPYDQLEPRFHKSIIYNGSTWKGNVMQNSVDGTYGRYMGYREDSYPTGRTVTGYYLRKLMDESNTDLVNLQSIQPWVELRLAEVYLNRAEAYYRLNNSAKASDDMNKVRERVGLPKKTGLTGDPLFKAIRQERKIELYMEGHQYWDMRRWELAHIEYNGYRTHGMKMTASGSDYLYQYIDCDLQDRKFLKKVYVLPIPYDELANNSAIDQYDEWK